MVLGYLIVGMFFGAAAATIGLILGLSVFWAFSVYSIVGILSVFLLVLFNLMRAIKTKKHENLCTSQYSHT